MNTHGTVRSVPTAQQIKQLGILLAFVLEVVTRIVTRYFFSLSSDEAKAFLQSKGKLSPKIKEALAPVFAMVTDEYAVQRMYWENFYQTYLGLVADFGEVVIPEKPTDGEYRLIFILKGLMMNLLAEAYRKILVAQNPQWKLYLYAEDLDAAIPSNIRTSAESYAIWVRAEQEADQEFLGQTTLQADADQKIGVTFLERFLHGIVYLVETKQHLNVKGFTLCSGSRGVDGDVPGVGWHPVNRGVFVSYYSLGYSYPIVGVRRAVALPQVVQAA